MCRAPALSKCGGPGFVSGLALCVGSGTLFRVPALVGPGALCWAPALCVGPRRSVSGPGGLCRAPALHHAQRKNVHNIACMLDRFFIFGLKRWIILLKLILCGKAPRSVSGPGALCRPRFCVRPWCFVSGPGALCRASTLFVGPRRSVSGPGSASRPA